MGHPRGFTLIEAMVTVSILGILAGITMWQMNTQLPRYRTNSAAGKLILDVRKATTIAIRTNRPVTLNVNPEGCNPGYTITQGDIHYDSTCFDRDYPGVGYRVGEGSIACATETAAGYGAIPGCSFCSGSHSISFLPTGAATTSSGADASLILAPLGDPTNFFDRAVGIRNVTGKARAYVRVEGGWDCP